MKGAERFVEILDKYNDRPKLLYGDPDTDGLFALRLMCEFAEMRGFKYSYYVNERRYHGFALDPRKLNGYLVIASDFSITKGELEQLVKNNVVVLSTDHHEIEDKTFIDIVGDTAEGIIINNQYEFEPEDDKYLSGAGVFFELVRSFMPEFDTVERRAMVGITLLSDVRAIENAKAREYLRQTYSLNDENDFARYLFQCLEGKDYGFGHPRLDRNYIDFKLSPRINTLLRFNMMTEVMDFVLGRGLGYDTYKDTQKNLLLDMEKRVKVASMNSIDVIWMNTTDFLDYKNVDIQGFLGLFCLKYKDKHDGKTTIGMIMDNGRIVRASFRGKYDDLTYRNSLRCLGIKAEGHPSAFGIKDFYPEAQTWVDIDDTVYGLEKEYTPTEIILDCPSLSTFMLKYGAKVATDNSYSRDTRRTFFRYTGSNYTVTYESKCVRELTPDERFSGVKPDFTSSGVDYKYERDAHGNILIKYREYSIDGRKVKSFGADVTNGLIMPIYERGYIELYLVNARAGK